MESPPTHILSGAAGVGRGQLGPVVDGRRRDLLGHAGRRDRCSARRSWGWSSSGCPPRPGARRGCSRPSCAARARAAVRPHPPTALLGASSLNVSANVNTAFGGGLAPLGVAPPARRLAVDGVGAHEHGEHHGDHDDEQDHARRHGAGLGRADRPEERPPARVARAARPRAAAPPVARSGPANPAEELRHPPDGVVRRRRRRRRAGGAPGSRGRAAPVATGGAARAVARGSAQRIRSTPERPAASRWTGVRRRRRGREGSTTPGGRWARQGSRGGRDPDAAEPRRGSPGAGGVAIPANATGRASAADARRERSRDGRVRTRARRSAIRTGSR